VSRNDDNLAGAFNVCESIRFDGSRKPARSLASGLRDIERCARISMVRKTRFPARVVHRRPAKFSRKVSLPGITSGSSPDIVKFAFLGLEFRIDVSSSNNFI